MKKQLDIKKLLLLNMPYILMGLFATNFGEAWRMAVGADASAKMLSFFSTLPVALASWWPSLHPLDLLVGLCCGAGLRLAVYLKSKNAKKYRHGMEYGSARWGTHEDIAPYIDPVFQNNVILTKTESLTMNSRPKDPKTARNKNVLVIGGSGSGKTRFWLKPNLMQMHSSYVVTDPKGTILVECGKMLQRGTPKLGKDGKPMKDKRGKVIYEPYRIKVLNTINFKKSMHYNPFAYIHSEKDILKLVTTLIANTKGEGKAGDDFWVKAETLLYCALIGYIHYEAPVEEQNFSTLIEFINAMEVREDDEEFKNPVDLMFDALEAEKPNHFAVRQYKKYKLAAGKTAKSILISCGARLAVFDIAELREVTSYDELELDTLGDRKTALFLIMSDTDDTVALDLPGFTAASARMDKKADAEQLKNACQGGTVTVKQVERKDKSEKPPALYDLTTLQRDANRLLGFTAQQTLDYLQNLYEKKLCTYPRTDSQYLTSDMAESLPVLVNLVANTMQFRKGIAISCDAAAVINDKKVTDHHAVIPTRNIREADLSALPVGERTILELVALRLLCAVAPPYIYDETSVTVDCTGAEFNAKGRTVKQPGWRALDAAYRASMKNAEPDKEAEDKALPELTEGQELPVTGAAVKEGKTTPPKHFTEDTLLSAMETAGKDDMPEDAERKGLGTPATRAGILEKLVSTGFLERKKSKKTVQLLPSHDAISLITVLPEQLQSPLLTAEWEYRLGEIERGVLAPEDFMAEITAMLKELVGTYQVIKGSEYLFAPPREVVGKCPRCGGEIAEMQKGFFCQDKSCKFAIWKNSKWWAAKRKQPTKAIVAALLKDGRAHVAGLYSEKSGKTYDATVVLEDTGQYVNFKLDFDRQKGGGK